MIRLAPTSPSKREKQTLLWFNQTKPHRWKNPLHPLLTLHPLLHKPNPNSDTNSLQSKTVRIEEFSRSRYSCDAITTKIKIQKPQTLDRSVNPKRHKKLYRERSHFHLSLCPHLFSSVTLFVASVKYRKTDDRITESKVRRRELLINLTDLAVNRDIFIICGHVLLSVHPLSIKRGL